MNKPIEIYNPGCSREDIADAVSHLYNEKDDDCKRQFAVPNYPASITVGNLAQDFEPIYGKEEERPKMRTLFKVHVIDKKDDTLLDTFHIIAEDGEEARIKAIMKLRLDYDSRVYMIHSESICTWAPENE